MQIIKRVADVRAFVRKAQARGEPIGLVPTMGALHAAHLKLAQQARGENDVAVMSIFVNPAQFGPSEDFARYPKPVEKDEELVRESGLIDVLFVPETEEMYPSGLEGQQVWIDPGPLGERLEGSSRPGHFRGVATVVAKLFNMVQPDRAYFGQKDAQQVAILRAMVRDLGFPVEIRVVPTVREADGLAASSRNAYLLNAERSQAPSLSRAIQRAQRQVQAGRSNAPELETVVRQEIEREAPLARIDYVAIVDPETFAPMREVIPGKALLALAVRFGDTRLIDNALLGKE